MNNKLLSLYESVSLYNRQLNEEYELVRDCLAADKNQLLEQYNKFSGPISRFFDKLTANIDRRFAVITRDAASQQEDLTQALAEQTALHKDLAVFLSCKEIITAQIAEHTGKKYRIDKKISETEQAIKAGKKDRSAIEVKVSSLNKSLELLPFCFKLDQLTQDAERVGEELIKDGMDVMHQKQSQALCGTTQWINDSIKSLDMRAFVINKPDIENIMDWVNVQFANYLYFFVIKNDELKTAVTEADLPGKFRGLASFMMLPDDTTLAEIGIRIAQAVLLQQWCQNRSASLLARQKDIGRKGLAHNAKRTGVMSSGTTALNTLASGAGEIVKQQFGILRGMLSSVFAELDTQAGFVSEAIAALEKTLEQAQAESRQIQQEIQKFGEENKTENKINARLGYLKKLIDSLQSTPIIRDILTVYYDQAVTRFRTELDSKIERPLADLSLSLVEESAQVEIDISGIGAWEEIVPDTMYYVDQEANRLRFLFAPVVLQDVEPEYGDSFLSALNKKRMAAAEGETGMKYCHNYRIGKKIIEVKIMRTANRIYGRFVEDMNGSYIRFTEYTEHT